VAPTEEKLEPLLGCCETAAGRPLQLVWVRPFGGIRLWNKFADFVESGAAKVQRLSIT